MPSDQEESRKDPDEELLRAARAAPEGDLRAFEELVVRYRNRIVTNCRHLTRDEGHAEDLSQEVFVKAFFNLPKFEERSSFRHWLNRIKVNHCLNHIKRSARRQMVAIDEHSAEAFEELQQQPRAARRVERMEARDRIDAVLEEMPETLRVPLVMRDMDELSYQEIADALKLGLSAVKMRIKRGREYFRELYAEMESAPAAGSESIDG